MKLALLVIGLFLPLTSNAVECAGAKSYVTSDSGASVPWKSFNVNLDGENSYHATLVDDTCSFTISYAKSNGSTYYVSISDLETTTSLSGLVAFDDNGKLQFNFNKPKSSTVCTMKCTK